MLPEKIIFAIDCDQRAGEYIRYRGHRDGFIHKLDVVKNALSLFIRQKHAMSQKHQFAICTLHKKVEMVCMYVCMILNFEVWVFILGPSLLFSQRLQIL